MSYRKRFFCQQCRVEEYTESGMMPYGWMSITQSLGAHGSYRRLGVFCSLDCLLARGPRMKYEIGETNWNPDWGSKPSAEIGEDKD